uniref:Uncharacterized protein n=1 Tax=Janibacter limosus TaxID=53458 RepID=A0AC61U1K2_9MICO|nr:hypothetical protein [Janibacter limosus]
MSDPTQRVLLTVEEYLDELLTTLLAGAAALDDVEDVPLAQALGRVLALPVHAAGDVPAFANSAMDGYAVLHDDLASLPATLRVVGAVPAGSSEDPAMGLGECVRIMTGAPLPSGADTVVPVEVTDGGTSTVTITEARTPGQHVRGAGEDVRARRGRRRRGRDGHRSGPGVAGRRGRRDRHRAAPPGRRRRSHG